MADGAFCDKETTTGSMVSMERIALPGQPPSMRPANRNTSRGKDCMPKTLTKIDIARSVAAELDMTRKQGLQLIENLMEVLKRSLERGEDVLVSGFGKFSVKSKNPRRGRNPATDEQMQLAARKVVSFKCSARLRSHVNGGK